MQKEHTFTVDGLLNWDGGEGGGLIPGSLGGLIFQIINSFENGWAYIWVGVALKTGGS